MFLFRHTDDSTRMYLTKILSIPELDGVYVRSFTILDDRIYFVSGNSNIIEADLYTFEVLNRYPVPDAIAGMIQLERSRIITILRFPPTLPEIRILPR